MPFGVKLDSQGTSHDFDSVYQTLADALTQLDFVCVRHDDLDSSVDLHRAVFEAIARSELMIVDISTLDPNVVYELGLRHALNHGPTILISTSPPCLPWNIAGLSVLVYELDEIGRLTGDYSDRFRHRFLAHVRSYVGDAKNGGPWSWRIGESSSFSIAEMSGQPRIQSLLRRRHGRFRENDEDLPGRDLPLVNPEHATPSSRQSEKADFLEELRKHRDSSDWDQMIRLADAAPPDMAQSAEVVQLVALGLNRRRQPDDADRAIAMLDDLITRDGGDSETFAILGRIHKDRYHRLAQLGTSRDAAVHFDLALKNYLAAFDENPNNHYAGIKVLTLLSARSDDASRDAVVAVATRVRAVLADPLNTGRHDYWHVTSQLITDVALLDWDRAEQNATTAVELANSSWMLAAVESDVLACGENFTDPERSARLERVLQILRRGATSKEASHD